MKTQYRLNANSLADLPYFQILRQGQASSNKALPEFLFLQDVGIIKSSIKNITNAEEKHES